MIVLKTFWFVITTLLQAVGLIALYWALSLGLYYLVTPHLPGYREDAALADLQAIVLLYLLWDRFFGPYSLLLRGVAKTLNAAMNKQRED